MGVPLWRAWEICRILEADDIAHDWDNDIGRAMVLSDPEPPPLISREPSRPPGRPRPKVAAPPPPPPPAPPERPRSAPAPAKRPPGRTIADRDPEAAARIAARRSRRLGA
jgi:hypothetical protein